MIDRSKDVDDYLATLAEDRRLPLTAMRDAICNNLPAGFVEVMADMPSYVVPLSRFPQGYHCSPDTPLPFLGFTYYSIVAGWSFSSNCQKTTLTL